MELAVVSRAAFLYTTGLSRTYWASCACSSRVLHPPCRMRKKSASGVLASLSGSPYGRVRFAASFAAALLDGLFAHPVGCSDARRPVCEMRRMTQ